MLCACANACAGLRWSDRDVTVDLDVCPMSQHVVHHMYVVPRLTISITINVSLKIEKNSSMNKRHRGARILAFVS